ncbi:heavy metal translocating P-type ATPase, partial [Mycobacterium kansasii]
EHPIGRAIAKAARDKVGQLPPVEGFANREGLGVQGIVDGHAMTVGRQLLADRCQQLPDSLTGSLGQAESEGKTAVVVSWDDTARG